MRKALGRLPLLGLSFWLSSHIEWFDDSEDARYGELQNDVHFPDHEAIEPFLYIGVIHTLVNHSLRLVDIVYFDRHGFSHSLLHLRRLRAWTIA